MSKHINIGNLGITLEYLSLPTVKKHDIIQKILDRSFNMMKNISSIQVRKDTLDKILVRSISILEEKEEYEECKILKEIKDYLRDYDPQFVDRQKIN